VKINRKPIGDVLFLIGWGITLHAVASELYQKGGYAEIFRPQGEWIGLGLIIIGWIIFNLERITERWKNE